MAVAPPLSGFTATSKAAPPRAKSVPPPMLSSSCARINKLSGAVAFALAFSVAGAEPPAHSELFPQQSVPTLKITVSPEGSASLGKDPRIDVPAVVREGSQSWSNVLVRLKGSLGSFRKFEDKPGL